MDSKLVSLLAMHSMHDQPIYICIDWFVFYFECVSLQKQHHLIMKKWSHLNRAPPRVCSFPLQYLFIQLNYYSYFIWNKYIQLCWCVYLSLLTPSDSVDYGVYVGRNLRSWFCAVCLSYMDQLAYLLLKIGINYLLYALMELKWKIIDVENLIFVWK